MEVNADVLRFRKASRALVRALGLLRNGGNGISLTQCHILLALERQPDLGVGQLSMALDLDKSTTSRAVSGLRRQGLVDQGSIPVDRREKPLALTEAGMERYRTIDREVNHQVSNAVSLLDREQRDMALAGIELYAKALNRAQFIERTHVRPAAGADNAELAAIIRAGLASFGADGPGTGYDDPEVDDINLAYSGPRRTYLVAEQEGNILGGAGIAPLKGAEEYTCELQRMYLRPEAQGNGLGYLLVNKCLSFAREKGYRTCYLETMTGMDKAQSLYRRLGFERQEVRHGKTGHCRCNLWFVKSLV